MLAACIAWSGPARADGATPSSDAVIGASDAFQQGIAFVKAARWGDALGAFERANALAPHALTSYNLGVTERALGHLTRARGHFVTALARNDATARKELSPSYVEEASALLQTVEILLVRLEVSIEPSDALLTVDGRPVLVDPTARSHAYVAGLAAVDEKVPPLPKHVRLLVDPGARVLVLNKPGYAPAITRDTFPDGSTHVLALSLTALEATISVKAERPGAVVRLEGLDVGVAPLTLRRPPGSYALDVRDPAYSTYSTTVTVGPGDHVDFFAKMPKKPYALGKQWWFWASLGGVVATATVIAIAVTRPPRDYDGGSTGWVATAP